VPRVTVHHDHLLGIANPSMNLSTQLSNTLKAFLSLLVKGRYLIGVDHHDPLTQGAGTLLFIPGMNWKEKINENRMKMIMMAGYIILRDVPKETAQLDLQEYEIAGGFRGFAMVPPGVHFVNVKRDAIMQHGSWCSVENDGVVIRVFDDDRGVFIEDTLENVATYTELARSGAMNRALIPVRANHQAAASTWERLTAHVNLVPFPPAMHDEQPMTPPANVDATRLGDWFESRFKSRFEQAFLGTHGAKVDSFLAEFEFAFLRMLLEQDDVATKRWQHLLLAAFNAGEHVMHDSPAVFPPLVDTIMAQVELLPGDFFKPGGLMKQGAYMAEDLVDTGVALLVSKGKVFGSLLSTRGDAAVA
jgi:hypothetical protein